MKGPMPSSSGRCPGDDSLLALMNSRVNREEVEPLLAHLDECADCRALAASLARGPASAKGVGAVPPDTAAPRLEPGARVGNGSRMNTGSVRTTLVGRPHTMRDMNSSHSGP